jgi:hypothetical protein
MKSLITILVALVIGSSYTMLDTAQVTHFTNPASFQADGPGTGNDGEDTSERGIMCRVFGVFC